MTSPKPGLRRTALVVLAAGATLGASACSAGQITQTGEQVAAVDGGQGAAGDLHVNDLQVVIPDSDEDEARVGFVVSYTGSGFGEAVSIERVLIDGEEVELDEAQPLERGCSLVVSAAEDAAPAPAQEGMCVEQITATLPSSDDLTIAQSVPATLTFSNGDVIETQAGVVAELTYHGEYTRPPEAVPATEGH